MIQIQLSEINNVLKGNLYGKSHLINAVTIDSRNVKKNSLFIAIQGENFDGHDFCSQAIKNGAVALIVKKKLDLNIPQIVVDSTSHALSAIGAYVKSLSNAKTIALTGSCGKTTVKEMIASVLSSLGSINMTMGNLNNHYGVPLTLLNTNIDNKYQVIELGANHQGEIKDNIKLVQPDVALVNNLTAAHLQGFGSMEGVAKAKGEIFSGLKNEIGTCIINLDSFSEQWIEDNSDKKIVFFSLNKKPKSNFFAKNIEQFSESSSFICQTSYGDEFEVVLNIPGIHNIQNALAAISCCYQLGVNTKMISEGLAKISSVDKRLEVLKKSDMITVINDSYNASYGSVISAIDVLNGFAGRKVFVFADMAELGKYSEEFHNKIAIHKSMKNFDVFTLGKYSKQISDINNGKHFFDKELLENELLSTIKDEKEPLTILIKGSRGFTMETLTKTLMES